MANSDNQNDFSKGSVIGNILSLALPMTVAQLINILYNVVDRMYIGRLPENATLSLTGLGLCMPIISAVIAFANLFGMGGAPLCSIARGKGDQKEAERIMGNAFSMLLVTGVILTVIGLLFKRPLLYAFGASDATYSYAEEYFTAYLCGTFFALAASGLNQFVICQGFAKMGMASVMLGAALNIALDPLFIFVFDMGVRGAAIATVISQAASAAFVVAFLFGKRVMVPITFGGYDLRVMGRVLVMGFTPFLIVAVDNVMIIAMNAILQRTGGADGDMLVTCNTIVQSFMLVVTMPLGGISGGTQGILGYNYGARQVDRVRKAQKYIVGLCVGYTAILFVLARVAGPLFVRLFTQEPELAQEAYEAIKVYTLAIIPLGVQYELVDGFTGMGQVRLSLPLSFWRKLVYFVAIFALPAAFGARAAFYAEPLSDILGPAVTVVVYFLAIGKVLQARTEPRGAGL